MDAKDRLLAAIAADLHNKPRRVEMSSPWMDLGANLLVSIIGFLKTQGVQTTPEELAARARTYLDSNLAAQSKAKESDKAIIEGD